MNKKEQIDKFINEFINSDENKTVLPGFVTPKTFKQYLYQYNKVNGKVCGIRGMYLIKTDQTPKHLAAEIVKSGNNLLQEVDLPAKKWQVFRVYLYRFDKGYITKTIGSKLFVCNVNLDYKKINDLLMKKELIKHKIKSFEHELKILQEEINDLMPQEPADKPAKEIKPSTYSFDDADEAVEDDE